jgi:uncharacterized protein
MIDCDVHNELSSSEDLLPFLEPYYRDYVQRGEAPGGPGSLPRATRPWLHPENYARTDTTPPGGEVPGTDYEFLREQLLDRYDVDVAVLTGDSIIDVSSLANSYYASALARAHNDYTIETWLSRDERLKGSIAVAPQDPAGAAEEIRRLGHHPDMVQVLLSSGSQRPYGDPYYHAIWEAVAEMDLPVAVHLGAQGGVNANPTGCGPPTFFWEYHALACETGMGHLASLVAHGIFEKYPNVRVILMELGLAWLPGVLWRLDADYKALRKETPWLQRLPSEYAAEHIRLSTQPLEVPRAATAFWDVLESMGGKQMLMFSSDYPHWDFDDPTQVAIPEAWRDAVFDENARGVYRRLPPKEDPSRQEADDLSAGTRA